MSHYQEGRYAAGAPGPASPSSSTGPATSASARARRRRLLAELGRVCDRIERLLAGQETTLKDLPLPQDADPGETDLDRLRRFKAVLDAALADHDRGRARSCEVCGAPLPETVLEAVPWARRCPPCAGA